MSTTLCSSKIYSFNLGISEHTSKFALGGGAYNVLGDGAFNGNRAVNVAVIVF